MDHLISAGELIARLQDAPAGAAAAGILDPPGPGRALRIIDATFELADATSGRRTYLAGHVPGAVYFSLDEDLSDPAAIARHGQGIPGSGGRHPLPDMAAFAARLGERGIGRDSDVVVYDQDGGMYAARAWWLLRYAGHRRTRFLDGGLAAYLAAGGPVTSEVASHAPTEFRLDLQHQLVMHAPEIDARLGEEGLAVIDARAPQRYRGEVEPLDAKAGHIPGAVNLHHQLVIDEETGLLLSAARLADVLELPAGTREAVAYCGSGVSAAHLILALEIAGLTGVKLYPGSWSDWSSRPGLPVATGEPGVEIVTG